MVSLGLRQLWRVLDPWILAAAVPAGLTICVITGLAWTESLGQAKPATSTVKQAPLSTALEPPAPQAPSPSDRHPDERGDHSHDRLPGPELSPQASEPMHVAELKAQFKRHLAFGAPVEPVDWVPFSRAASADPAPVATELATGTSAEMTAPALAASKPAAVETEPAPVMSTAVGLDRNRPKTPYLREPPSETKPGSTQETSTIPNPHEERGALANSHRGALRPGTPADEQGRRAGRVTSPSSPRPTRQAAAPVPSSGASTTGDIDIVVHSTNQRREEDGAEVKQVGLNPSRNSRDTTRNRNPLRADPLPYAQGTARRRTTGAAAPSTVATASTGEPTILERIFQFRLGTSQQADSLHGDGDSQRGDNGGGVGAGQGTGVGDAANAGGASAGDTADAGGAGTGGSANAGEASGGSTVGSSGAGSDAAASAGDNGGAASAGGNAGGNGGGNAGGNGGGNAGGGSNHK